MSLFCCFQDNLTEEFRVFYEENDTYHDLKLKIKMEQGLHDQDIKKWQLYRPGHVLDKSNPFILSTAHIRLPPKQKIKNIRTESGDPDIDVVIVCREQGQSLPPKKMIELLDIGGIILHNYTP